jgi:nanoRNase/pAp phosphatase (c-di-AMP/oligoRNAs hydrolase)
MDDQKQQLIDKLQSATNILVTVSSNPSVDQLAACIGLTVALNKMDKHATAVFSGDIPETIEFLKPEATIEKNTDSLRDFIIALDKTKADKLRYKVEDKVVKIFITPYRTSISEDDLNFSQGDFNVDAVLALGVRE